MTSILITGAGRGIGFELARLSLENGWQVYGSVRSEKAVEALRQALPKIKVLVFDVTDSAALTKAADQITSPIDIVVNNAGIISPDRQSTMDMDFDGFAEALAVNTIAPLRVAQAFRPHLAKSNQARVVAISSNMGRMQNAKSDRIAYRASKSALNKIVQALATDLKPEGICCIAMHPGWVKTDMGSDAADISATESAAGILRVVENLTMKDTNQFIDWDGTRQDW